MYKQTPGAFDKCSWCFAYHCLCCSHCSIHCIYSSTHIAYLIRDQECYYIDNLLCNSKTSKKIIGGNVCFIFWSSLGSPPPNSKLQYESIAIKFLVILLYYIALQFLTFGEVVALFISVFRHPGRRCRPFLPAHDSCYELVQRRWDGIWWNQCYPQHQAHFHQRLR